MNNELNNTVLYHFKPRIKDAQEDSRGSVV